MNNTLKNSIVGGLAIFGLVSLISSSVSPSTINEVSYGTPESHVWESNITNEGRFYIYNKKTGEVRKMAKGYPTGGGASAYGTYIQIKPNPKF